MLKIEKSRIIEEIIRITEQEKGSPPGERLFTRLTGIRKSSWYPYHWLRWSEAVVEAGYEPNMLSNAYESDFLIEKYIELIRELKHFPVEGEIKRKRARDANFPSHNAFRRLGTKQEIIQSIINFAKEKERFSDVITYCRAVLKTRITTQTEEYLENIKVGYVYLVQHGSLDQYKIGKTFDPIRRLGEIKSPLPLGADPVHTITTDDPTGVEKYWHTRFSGKRLEGEWFALSRSDVEAFKKWKRIY